MRAIVADGVGGPEVLSLGEVPDPVAAAGEVVIDVVATAVNRADTLQREGRYAPPPGATDVIGLECAGIVASVADDVTTWRAGDEVCALLSGGGYAERVAVPAGQCLPVPDGMSMTEAAALPETVCTVWSNLVMVAGLDAGEVVLLHGGASGIGTTGIQIAKQLGATVIVTAGSGEKLERCRALGADFGINYREEDFLDRVRELTDGRGADVVLDIMGAKYLSRNVEVLAVGGRLVVIGLQGGVVAELNLAQLLAKRASVTATSLRGRPVEQKAAIVAAVREHVWPWVEQGAVRPVIDRVLPLADAAEAHRVMAASEHVGKIVLAVDRADHG
jgi:putative PIG3 family NAD(P)H quinone oxidoreductase